VAGIRTVMVTAPALLGDVIDRLAVGRIELDLVGRLYGRRALVRRLNRLQPDLVIIGLRTDEGESFVLSLLMELPRTRFIAILPDGRSIAGYELRVSHVELSALSPREVIDFIDRGVAGVRP
jgi:hypothetical protein